MVGLSVLLKDKVTVETLNISDNGYDPSVPSARGWFINPLGVNTTLSGWAVIGAFLPAVLVLHVNHYVYNMLMYIRHLY